MPRFPRSLQPPYKSFFRFLANVSSFPSSLLPVLFFCGDRPHGPSHVAFHFLFFLFSWFLSCSCQLASALVLRRTRVFSRCVFVAPSFFFPCPSYFFVKGFFFLFHPRLFFFFPFCLFLFRHPRFAFLPFFLLPRSSRRQLVVFVQSSFVLFFVKGCSFSPLWSATFFPPLLFVPLFERGVEKKDPSLLGSFARVGVVFILF